MRFILSALILAILTPVAGAIADHTKPMACTNRAELTIGGRSAIFRECDGYYGFTHTERFVSYLD